jgi:hypothetical protein
MWPVNGVARPIRTSAGAGAVVAITKTTAAGTTSLASPIALSRD